jgi:ATP-dependent Lhr-like helicase
MDSIGQQIIREWYRKKNWEQFPFQKEMEEVYLSGYSGLLNAPTGSGKTFALFLPFLIDPILINILIRTSPVKTTD